MPKTIKIMLLIIFQGLAVWPVGREWAYQSIRLYEK